MDKLELGDIYTPSYPIEIKDLFSWREDKLIAAIWFINQKWRQIIIFWDRWVWKTSFANIIKIITGAPWRQVVKISCSSEDTYESLWYNIFSEITIGYTEEVQSKIWFGESVEKIWKSVSFWQLYKREQINLPTILKALWILNKPVIIIDEFDRLESETFNKKLFTDTIKAISDTLPDATLIIVWVSEDVWTLIQEHESIERNLWQIYMPSMPPNEIKSIILKWEDHLDIKFDDDVVEKIIKLSSGYPHFTHALCYYSVTVAQWSKSKTIKMEHLLSAIKQTVDNAHESLRNSYRIATLATKKNMYQEVLYAASLVDSDEYWYFQANDLEPIISSLFWKELKVTNFTFHLWKFCSTERWDIFRVTWTKNRHRYKFKNPLMKAFIKLKIESESIS
jgi:Cdc6-like AAA superfamily ATPase